MKPFVLAKITDYQDHIQASFGLSPDFSGFSSIVSYCKSKFYDPPLDVYLLDVRDAQWLTEKVIREKPPLLGLSFDLRSAKRSRFYARELREQGYRGEIVLGGTQINAVVAEALTRFMPDIYTGFVVGPGEEPVAGLIAGNDPQEISNYYFVKDGTLQAPKHCMQLPDLDNLPFPDLGMIQRSGIDPGKVMQCIRTQYGCQGNCIFCYGTDYPQMQMRPDTFHALVRYYLDRGISRFMFIDDEFSRQDRGTNLDITQVLCELNATHPGLKNNGLIYEAFFRSDSFLLPNGEMDSNLLGEYIKSGLRIPYIGIDAGNPADIRFYGKALHRKGQAGHSPDEWYRRTKHLLREFYRYLQEHRLAVWPFLGFIHMNTHSTPDSLRANIDFIATNTNNPSPLLFFWPLHPYPTSAIGSRMLREYIQSNNAAAALDLVHGQPIYRFDDPVVERYAGFVARLREIFRPQKLNSEIMKRALDGKLDQLTAIRLRDANCLFHLGLLHKAEQGENITAEDIHTYMINLKALLGS